MRYLMFNSNFWIYNSSLCLIFLFLSITATAQHLTEDFKGNKENLNLSLTEVYPLEENLFLLSKIEAASLNDNFNLVLSMDNSPGIVLYGEDGNQIRQIGSIGRGPGEYSEPGAISLSNDILYIWDAKQLKFLKYNTTKNEPLLEIKEFRWSVQDFVTQNNNIFFYNDGRSTGPFIEQYNISENKYGKKFGNRTPEHTVLMSMSEAGGIDADDNYLYYISPSSLVLNKLDFTNFTEKSTQLDDNQFKVPKVNNARKTIRNIDEMTKIINKSSRVVNLMVLDTYIVVVAKTGESKYSSEFNAYSAENRKIKFYILNKQMHHLDTFVFSVAADGDIQDGIWGSNSDRIFFLSTYNLFGEESPNDPNTPLYYMHLWNIEKIMN